MQTNETERMTTYKAIFAGLLDQGGSNN